MDETKYNVKIPAVKRLMREASELREPTEEYCAKPLDDNLFEWHFTVRGAPATEFENGFYHGRIILPNEYPMKPPNIILLTPNGRFEVNKKICLSISAHHPETWQPSWSIRTALLGLIAFMPTPGKGTIGSLDYTPEERRTLARKSQKWECPTCGPINQLLGSKSGAQSSSIDDQIIQNCVFEAEAQPSVPDPAVDPLLVPTEPTPQPNYESPEPSGFWIGDTTSSILITIILAAIAFLVYRRLYLV